MVQGPRAGAWYVALLLPVQGQTIHVVLTTTRQLQQPQRQTTLPLMVMLQVAVGGELLSEGPELLPAQVQAEAQRRQGSQRRQQKMDEGARLSHCFQAA